MTSSKVMIVISVCLMLTVIVVNAQYQWCTLVPPINRQTTSGNPLSTLTPTDKKIIQTEKIIFEYITDNLLEDDVVTDYYIN